MLPELVPLPEAPKTVSTPKTLPPPKLGQMQDQLKEKEKQIEAEGGKKVQPPKDKLQKVLDILHELGVIHLIDKTRLPNNEDSGTMTATTTINNNANYKPTAQAFEAAYNDPNPIYCFGNGVPRMDTVWPEQILNEIKLAGEEVLRMKERVDILKKTLLAVDEANKQANNAEGGENAANSSESSEAAQRNNQPPNQSVKVQQPNNMPFKLSSNCIVNIPKLFKIQSTPRHYACSVSMLAIRLIIIRSLLRMMPK